MRFQARGFLYKLFGQFEVASDTGCGGGGGFVELHCGSSLWDYFMEGGEFWPSVLRNLTTANEKGDSVPKIVP